MRRLLMFPRVIQNFDAFFVPGRPYNDFVIHLAIALDKTIITSMSKNLWYMAYLYAKFHIG